MERTVQRCGLSLGFLPTVKCCVHVCSMNINIEISVIDTSGYSLLKHN